MANAHLHRAQTAKNDEFYTQRADIEKELQYYTAAFRDKVVYCNCDDYLTSEFVAYFKDNFKALGLKKLVSTAYNPAGGTKMELTPAGNMLTKLDGDGDFRSEECLALLKESDIVVTNPPFSLLLDFLGCIREADKQYLFIAPDLALTYPSVFPLFFSGLVQIGGSGLGMKFLTPEGSYAKFGCMSWLTNLPSTRVKEKLPLTKSYSPEEYPTYDNYEGIEVSRLKDLPKDYTGIMGVPITILGKLHPEQFELIGMIRTRGYMKEATVDGEPKFLRVFIKRKQKE